MSTTDQRPSPNDQRAAPKTTSETKPKIDLSFTQVMGGALAAMTAAFLGSRLSLAGTVAGAAVASIVAAVASNVYTASLRTTREKMQTVFRGRIADSDLPVTVEATDDTFTWSDAQPAAARTPAPPQSPRQRRWPSVVLGALAAFALAAAVLTGLELASGQSLSGGNGTTVTQVAERKPAADPTSEPSRATPSPSPSPSPSATSTPQPSATASSEPSATPGAPEPVPSATSSATPAPSTPVPSSTGTPDPASGDQAGAAAQGAAGTG